MRVTRAGCGNGMKFDAGADTVSTLVSQTQGQNQDLGSLMKSPALAAEPLEDKFNGPGKAAFDQFKSQTDAVANSPWRASSAARRA